MSKNNENIDRRELRYEKIEDIHEDIIKDFQIDEKSEDEVELKKFLIEDALNNQLIDISTTYLWFYNPKNELIGFVTILVDAIRVHESKILQRFFREQGVPYRTLPALKIGRMCVNREYKRMAIGTYMLLFSMANLISINKYAGCRFVLVDAKRDAVNFYKKFGFKYLKERKKGVISMYYDMTKILEYIRKTKIDLVAEKTTKPSK